MSNNQFSFENQEYDVKIEEYCSRGWDIFKQYPGGFIGYLVVTFLISVASSMLPAPFGNSKDEVGGIVNFVLNPIFSAGFYIVALQIAKNRPKDFSDFFRGFNQFLQLFLVYIVGTIITIIGFKFKTFIVD